MADNKEKPFPGSPTGNRSGVGAPAPEQATSKDKPTDPNAKKPTAPFPGSPTGNASGVGKADKKE